MTSFRRVLAVIFLTVIVAASASPLEKVEINPNAIEDINYRLDDSVLPSHYKIKLTPYFENEGSKRAFTFDGEVEITLKASKLNVNEIVLHAFDLTIASYSFNGGASILYNASYYNEQYNKWTIPIPNGGFLSEQADTILKVEYVGYMKDDMYGFYRSYYYENGKKVYMGTTQFQPDHARRAFPCFDEPGFKATFQLTIVRPINVARSISNAKLLSTDCDEMKCNDVFKTTTKMSTYLLAFIVSDYKGSLENTEAFGVYARPEAQPHTDYAVKFGISMLNNLSDYFGIDYYSVQGVEKMDMAAIPDFSAGAMENWGLLTFRETLVLYDPDETPTLNQQRIAAVIAHEQLHMWYGDLVTCKWWSQTWMNEAFARYFQFMGLAFIYDDWELEEQFVIENLQQSMQLDSTDSTHPMTTVINTKKEAADIFDNISYNKGASILRWLSYFTSKETFREILSFHIDSHKHEAVVPADFFSAIASKSTGEASEFFESWTNQSGFPLVTSSLENNVLKLTQKRFMRSNGIENDKTEIYRVPISIALDESDFSTPNKHDFYLTKASEEFTVTKTPTGYYMLNVQQTGFYRVHYSYENWQKIGDALASENFDKIHVLNRAQVVDDLFHLSRVGIVEYSQAINIIRFLKNETHYIPWLAAISQGLSHLSQRVREKDIEIFNWFVNDLMDNIYKHLTFEPRKDESRTEVYNRVNILTWVCKHQNEECIEKSKEAFEDYAISFKKVPKDHRIVVYCNAIRYGGDEEFNFLFDRLMSEGFAQEQINILTALGCSKDEKNIRKLLGRLIRTEDIRPQDRNTVINSVLNSNFEGVNFLYEFITANYGDWQKTFENLGTLSTVVSRFTEESQLKKFEDFLEKERSGLGELHTSLSSAVDVAKENLAWDEKHMKEFIGYLYELNSAPMNMISFSLAAIAFVCLYILN